MTSEELRHLEELPSPHNKFWVPCMWFVNLALRARTEGRINNDVALTAILTVGVRERSAADLKSSFTFRRYRVDVFSSCATLFYLLGVKQFAGKMHEAVWL